MQSQLFIPFYMTQFHLHISCTIQQSSPSSPLTRLGTMVGAPVTFSGEQPHPPTNPDGTSKYAPPPQTYATPNATISALLPYNGQTPPMPSPYGQAASAPMPSTPINMTYLFPPAPPSNPPTSAPYPMNSAAPPLSNTPTSSPYPVSSAAAPPPFPPYSTAPFPSFSTGYPPAPPPAFPAAASSYPPHSGVAPAPAPARAPAVYPPSGYPPQAPSGYPTGQQVTGSYPPPAAYPPPANPTSQAPPYPSAGGFYPHQY